VKRAGKDVAQLGMQAKQSVDPLFVGDDFAKAQGGQLDYSELEEFMLTTGLTKS
jgi:hypothetical protein